MVDLARLAVPKGKTSREFVLILVLDAKHKLSTTTSFDRWTDPNQKAHERSSKHVEAQRSERVTELESMKQSPWHVVIWRARHQKD
jgi:PIN domain nuclease of toxin-antitoxin system